jgi:hypothetical protein
MPSLMPQPYVRCYPQFISISLMIQPEHTMHIDSVNRFLILFDNFG